MPNQLILFRGMEARVASRNLALVRSIEFFTPVLLPNHRSGPPLCVQANPYSESQILTAGVAC